MNELGTHLHTRSETVWFLDSSVTSSNTRWATRVTGDAAAA